MGSEGERGSEKGNGIHSEGERVVDVGKRGGWREGGRNRQGRGRNREKEKV
jgi:hypothetical protein